MDQTATKEGAQMILSWLAQNTYLTSGATTKIHLFKNNLVPSYNTTEADLTEADFTGYPSGGIAIAAWSNIGFDPITGIPFIRSLSAPTFVGGTPFTTPNTIYGWWIDDGGPMQQVCRFDTAFEMDAYGKTITIVPEVEVTGVEGTSGLVP